MAHQETKAHAAPKPIIIKFLIVYFYLALSSSVCFAQVSNKTNTIKTFDDVKKVISKNYKIEQSFLDTTCLDIVVLLKFKVINNKIDSIQFSKATPLPIITTIKKALQFNVGELALNNAKSFENKNIVIPMIFTYSTGCKAPPGIITVASNGSMSISKDLDADKSLKPTLLDILNFEGGYKWAIDCVLLSPMSFTAMY